MNDWKFGRAEWTVMLCKRKRETKMKKKKKKEIINKIVTFPREFTYVRFSVVFNYCKKEWYARINYYLELQFYLHISKDLERFQGSISSLFLFSSPGQFIDIIHNIYIYIYIHYCIIVIIVIVVVVIVQIFWFVAGCSL